jgi:hypothetical protein
MTDISPKDALTTEFQDSIRELSANGKTNHMLNIYLTIGAVLASLLATALVSAEHLPKVILALFTALPAAFATVQSSVAFRRKSHWYFMQATRIGALQMELRFDPNPDLQNYAKRRAQIGLEMEPEWGNIEDEAATEARARESAKHQVQAAGQQ